MPDWNPAEIVGIKPNLLAISTYQQLITNGIWAQQRAEFGYKDVRPHPLIVCFAGHPYVDVRASINSFIPQNISEETTERLVNCFIQRLEANPEWHDKLEFQVMPTCHTFDFDSYWLPLIKKEAQLSTNEALSFKYELLTITKNSLEKCDEQFAAISEVEKRFEDIKDSDISELDKIWYLIEDCKRGTLIFSHLARCGFIANSLLNSAVASNILSPKELDDILHSFSTITGYFSREAHLVEKGELDRETFIEKYGHLRPGTYDITSPAYRTDPTKYMFNKNSNRPDKSKVNNNPTGKVSFNKIFCKKLEELLNTEPNKFYKFIQKAICGREYSKFVFSKHISLILDLIEKMGNEFGFSTKELSHLSIIDILAFRNGLNGEYGLRSLLKEKTQKAYYRYKAAQSLELPPLLINEKDFFSFYFPKTLPNFIGKGKAVAPLVYLKISKHNDQNLSDKLVLIEKADPGFDWIFNHSIAGLITVYGGPNSHMAIRSSEFEIPASIGVGRIWFDKLKYAQLVELDCDHHSIKILQ
jgi:hypothetical protein